MEVCVLPSALSLGWIDQLATGNCTQEGIRIPPLERYRQPLEQEHGFSIVLSDRCYAFADLLD